MRRSYLFAAVSLCGIPASDPFYQPANTSFTIARYSSSELSFSELLALVTIGQPFILTNVTDLWDPETSAKSLTCDDYSRLFPDGLARVEYVANPNTPQGHYVKLADKPWRPQLTRGRTGTGPTETTTAGSPAVWHVKDQASAEHKAAFGRLFPGIPPLLGSGAGAAGAAVAVDSRPDSCGLAEPWQAATSGRGGSCATSSTAGRLLNEHVQDSAELWLQPGGSGAELHADAYCSGVFSVQLQGAKVWRLKHAPAFRNLVEEIFDDHDGGYYEKHPDQRLFGDGLEETSGTGGACGSEGAAGLGTFWDGQVRVQAGEAIFFPPGMLHETRSLSGAAAGSGACSPSAGPACTVSVTSLLRYPYPATYIARYLPGISIVGEGRRCMKEWGQFALLARSVEAFNRRGAFDGLWARVDGDMDGYTDEREVMEYLMREEDGRKLLGQAEIFFFGFGGTKASPAGAGAGAAAGSWAEAGPRPRQGPRQAGPRQAEPKEGGLLAEVAAMVAGNAVAFWEAGAGSSAAGAGAGVAGGRVSKDAASVAVRRFLANVRRSNLVGAVHRQDPDIGAKMQKIQRVVDELITPEW